MLKLRKASNIKDKLKTLINKWFFLKKSKKILTKSKNYDIIINVPQESGKQKAIKKDINNRIERDEKSTNNK